MKKTMLFALAAFAPLAIASAASAQDAPIATADTPVTASEVVVQAQIAYRNRSEQTAPVLEYGLDYFPALRTPDRRRRPQARAQRHLPVGRAGVGRRPSARP
ncbi:MAG TPA: hypothetical protein PLH31_09840 [Caulobacter sp.]|nr:hypothetical protein [Caulobacter sp.]